MKDLIAEVYELCGQEITTRVADRIKSMGLALVVADTLPMQMDILRDGLSHGQVGQRPYEMGYRAMFILKDIVDGKQVDDPIYTGLDVCTPENIDNCLSG